MGKGRINIAIDGHSGCGKSSTAKALAKLLHYTYIDTGAMYRAVTLYFLDHHIQPDDREAVDAALRDIHIQFERTPDGQVHTWLNGKDVEDEIRTPRVSGMVSPVSTISAVRRALVRQQQRMGQDKGVVMDGRDIGTVVFPDADLKIFMTADPVVRAARRKKEMDGKGITEDEEAIMENLLERDKIDSTREDSPLKKAPDALEIDTTHLQLEDQIDLVYRAARRVIDGRSS